MTNRSGDGGMYWVRERFHRGAEIERRTRQLPAALYNTTRWLLSRASRGCVFVPIRSMQYLAVIDTEEIIFVDGLGDHSIEFAWLAFRPQSRTSLEDPVPHVSVAYDAKAWQTQLRIHTEFSRALTQLAERVRRGEVPPDAENLLTFRR